LTGRVHGTSGAALPSKSRPWRPATIQSARAVGVLCIVVREQGPKVQVRVQVQVQVQSDNRRSGPSRVRG